MYSTHKKEEQRVTPAGKSTSASAATHLPMRLPFLVSDSRPVHPNPAKTFSYIQVTLVSSLMCFRGLK